MRITAVFSAIVVLHVVAWGILIVLVIPHHYTVGTQVFGIGLGVTAYTLGLRHAFDADHIAAIDNTTRKLMGDGKRPVSVGFWFALGHSTVVLVLAVLIAVGAHVVGSLITILRMVGIVAAVFGVQIVVRIYAEEIDYRVEPLLGAALSRARYLASNAVLAFAAPAVALLVSGTVIGLVAASAQPGISVGEVLGQALATVPAVLAMIALALAAVGANPRMRLVGWLGVVATFALTLLGPLFRLWGWILGISPLWHMPDVTAAGADWSGLSWVAIVAVLLTVVAFTGFRRRDVI